MEVFASINDYIETIDIKTITTNRRSALELLINYIQQKQNSNEVIRLNFVCTHNSRRSHLSQIWAQTMACHFGVDSVFCYSGGTEETALYPMVASVLTEIGFCITHISEGNNPIYSIKYAENSHPIIGFSKQVDHDFNPKSKFCAIMTCSSAAENCPSVLGAEKRIAITYEDPKIFDNMDIQFQKYQERSLQIATEMCYVFSQIKK